MIFSSLIPYFKNKNNPQYMALGASGAISAIVFAFILLYPTEKLIIFLFLLAYQHGYLESFI